MPRWPVCASGCNKRGLKLMLDFVPNHMASDHPWVEDIPDYFIHGTELDLARAPQNYCRVQTQERGDWCSPTAAIPTLTAGPTRCSSTTATRHCRKR